MSPILPSQETLYTSAILYVSTKTFIEMTCVVCTGSDLVYCQSLWSKWMQAMQHFIENQCSEGAWCCVGNIWQSQRNLRGETRVRVRAPHPLCTYTCIIMINRYNKAVVGCSSNVWWRGVCTNSVLLFHLKLTSQEKWNHLDVLAFFLPTRLCSVLPTTVTK